MGIRVDSWIRAYATLPKAFKLANLFQNPGAVLRAWLMLLFLQLLQVIKQLDVELFCAEVNGYANP